MDANGNSEALSGYGTGFFLIPPGGDKIEIDEVTKVPFAEEMAETFEKTHFKSPGGRKEYGRGLIEPGEDTIEINYIAGSPTDLAFRAAHASGKPHGYETYLPAPEGKWCKISGFLIVRSRGRSIPINDRMVQTINVQFTGAAEEGSADDQPVIPPAGGGA